MERQPYFQVGEEVTLVSRSHPDYNGEYTIFKILQDNEEFNDRLNDEYLSVSDGLTYIFEVPLRDEYSSEGLECLWCESALRKKYKPSEFSFNEMLSKIKCPA